QARGRAGGGEGGAPRRHPIALRARHGSALRGGAALGRRHHRSGIDARGDLALAGRGGVQPGAARLQDGRAADLARARGGEMSADTRRTGEAAGTAVRVRPAVAPDAPVLARLRYLFRAELGTPAESEETFLARCTPWMRERLEADGPWRCWLAEAEGVVVG